MNKLKVTVLVLSVLLLTGLGIGILGGSIAVNLNNDNAAKKEEEQISPDNQQDGIRTETPTDNAGKGPAEENRNNMQDNIKLPDYHEPESEEKTGRETGKTDKLDFEALDKLDNTKYSWWLKLNNRHETPGIPSDAQELIEKYDGIFTGNIAEKAVYLTFDEGYENGYTGEILDILKENDVKTIFFVTGSYIKRNPELVKRMLDEGHQVGNHSINHPSLPSVDNVTMEKELYGLEKEFQDKFNEGFKYMRPPSGEYSERVMAAVKQLGYKTVFWSFAYRDFDVNDQKGPDYAYKQVMDNLHNGAVILLHAVSSDNTKALDRIIKDLKAQGYEIRPFDL